MRERREYWERSLAPRLLERDHTVAGTSSTKEKLRELERMGLEPMLMNGLDRSAVLAAVSAARPEVVVNEMTALANVRNYKNFDREFAVTNRLHTEGTASLLTAARASGVQRIVVQNFAGWPLRPGVAPANPEEAPFAEHLPARMRETQSAFRQMEEMVLASQSPTGIVLRYGLFYGRGTSFDLDGEMGQAVRKRGLPLVGGGTGISSFIHIDDAAEATRIAIEGAPARIYHITDDHPAPANEWLPELARLLHAKQPMNIPAWRGRIFAGESGLYLMTQARGAANSKAKAVLNWRPAYPDWRGGFASMVSRA